MGRHSAAVPEPGEDHLPVLATGPGPSRPPVVGPGADRPPTSRRRRLRQAGEHGLAAVVVAAVTMAALRWAGISWSAARLVGAAVAVVVMLGGHLATVLEERAQHAPPPGRADRPVRGEP